MTDRHEFGRILAENQRYAEAFDRSALTSAPLTKLAIVACMDARLDIRETLGLRTGDAHIIRNAGGLATDDVIRSLIISQQLMGTEEIVIIGHTGCGLLGVDEDAIRERLGRETGETLEIDLGAFGDLEATVRASVERLRGHPWLKHVPIHGLVFDVKTGRLREIA